MKKILMLGVALAAVAAWANTTWTGAGTDRKWSNPDNWSNGVPTGGQGEIATLPTGNWEVEIDTPATHLYYALVLSDGAGTARFTGAGTLQNMADPDSNCRIAIGAGRELLVDGPNVVETKHLQEGRLTLRSGTVTQSSDRGIALADGASIVLEGGMLSADLLNMTDGVSSLRLKGGTLKFTDEMSNVRFADETRVSLESGTLVASQAFAATNFPKLMPPKNVRLDILSKNDKALNLTPKGDYSFGGTIAVTNGGTAYLQTFGTDDGAKWMHVYGRGTFYLDKINLSAVNTGRGDELDLSAFYLGAGGVTFNSHNGYLKFLNGVRLGAYADWTYGGTNAKTTSTSYLSFQGPCVFDTRDPFDATKSHAITMLNVNLSEATSLQVTGGGSVSFRLNSLADLDTLAVDGKTDLAITSTVARCLGVRSLSVEEGSTLSLWPADGVFLDVTHSFSAAAGSIKLEFDPAFATNRCPIAFWPEGTKPDLTVFDAGKVPTGHYLEASSNIVYLTDGGYGRPDHTETDKAYWTGKAGDALLTTAGNWSNGTALGGSTSHDIYFDGWQTPTISNGDTALRFKTFNVLAYCGPIRIVGSSYFRAHQGGETLVSRSSYPTVIDVNIGPMYKAAQNCYNLGVRSLGLGSFTLLKGILCSGGSASVCGDFTFRGDVRLGGTTAGNLLTNIVANAADNRANQLTLLPGAKLTNNNQQKIIGNTCSFDVSETAELTFGGTQLAFSKQNGHVVDGTWTISCPLVATAKQSFRGSGTVKIASLADAAGGIELAGTVTCEPGATWNAATPMICRGTPTLKTAAATSVTLGGQTIEIEPHSTLAVDTAAGDLTLNSPVTGDGNLTKKGTGNLVLGATGSVFDTLTIEAGTITLTPALAEQAKAGGVALFTARKVVGDLSFEDLRLIKTETGATTTYSVRARKGLAVIVK